MEFKLQDQEKAAREKLKARDKRGACRHGASPERGAVWAQPRRLGGAGALFALKRKKMYEGEVSKIQGARMTLEQQRMALESMVTNMEVFSTMRSTAGVMGDMHQNLYAWPQRGTGSGPCPHAPPPGRRRTAMRRRWTTSWTRSTSRCRSRTRCRMPSPNRSAARCLTMCAPHRRRTPPCACAALSFVACGERGRREAPSFAVSRPRLTLLFPRAGRAYGGAERNGERDV